MTKKQLRLLIKECLNEIDFAPGFKPSEKELTIVATVTGYDVQDLLTYLKELHRILIEEFGQDVVFDEKLNSSVLPNKDKKTEATFTIKNQNSLERTKLILGEIHEELTMWSIQQDLVIDFNFRIKK